MERQGLSERENNLGNFEVLSRPSFVNEFAQKANLAKERVWIKAMYVYNQDAMRIAEPSIVLAAEKGLDVRVVADYISYLMTEGTPSYLARIRGVEQQRVETFEMFERLKRSGVKVDLTNPPTLAQKIFPYTGRNHIKICAVDDTFYVGGVNWENLNSNDFMVRITDPNTVKVIENQFDRYNDRRPKEDMSQQANSETQVLIDSGHPGKSIIYDKSLELIRNEQKKITYISQLFPEGKILDELIKVSEKGVVTDIFVPNANTLIDQGVYVINRLAEKSLIRSGKKLPIKFLSFFIHTKALIGSQKAIFGSHNFSESGVRAGTEEIAIESSNPILIFNLNNFVNELTGRVE